MQATVQHMEVWADTEAPDARTVDVYSLEEPEQIDLIRVSGTDPEKLEIMEWKVSESPVEGCLRLHSPKAVEPSLPLMNKDIPCLCLLREREVKSRFRKSGVA